MHLLELVLVYNEINVVVFFLLHHLCEGLQGLILCVLFLMLSNIMEMA